MEIIIDWLKGFKNYGLFINNENGMHLKKHFNEVHDNIGIFEEQ